MKYIKLIVLIVLATFLMLKAGEMAMSDDLQAEEYDEPIQVKTGVYRTTEHPVEYISASQTIEPNFTELPTHLRVEAVYDYLEEIGATFEEQMQIQEIIHKETKHDPFNPYIVPSQDINYCDRFVTFTLFGNTQTHKAIELHDVGTSRLPATCEDYGAVTLSTSKSKGLMQITEPTWVGVGCTGDPLNWKDNVKCGLKILRERGCKQWSTCTW